MPSDDPLPVNIPEKISPRKHVTAPDGAAPSGATSAFRRDRVTWASYLALGLFTFFLNVQGNIIPFLRDEFALSYGVVSLHPGALAGGLILCGLVGDRMVTRLGRRWALALGFAGLCGGAALLSVAPTAAGRTSPRCLGNGIARVPHDHQPDQPDAEE